MKIPLCLRTALPLALLTLAGCSTTTSPIRSLGNNTYEITRQAGSGIARDTEKLKAEALEEAAAYCAQQHKELKVVSATADKPSLMLTGYAKARVVFKALAADDPELHAAVVATPAVAPSPAATASTTEAVLPAPRSATDALYNDLVKLDDLRKRGILTEEEFQAQKKKLLDH